MNLSQRMLELQRGINLSSLVASLGSEKTDPERLRKCWGKKEKMVTRLSGTYYILGITVPLLFII